MRPSLSAMVRLPERLARWLASRPHAPVWIVLAGVLLASPALLTAPVADDLLLELSLQNVPGSAGLEPRAIDLFRFATGDPERARASMNEGVFPWWADPTARLSFFRPLAGLTHWLDFRYFGGRAWSMHLQSLLWFAALLAALAFVYRRLAPPPTALLALLFYAIDDAHAPSVAWIANRNALLSLCFSLLALGAHVAWRQGAARLAWLPPCLFGLALLAGESAVSLAGYLVAYACFLERGPWASRLLTLVGPALVLIVWRVLYVKLGYGASGSGIYVDPLTEPLAFARAAAERLPVLLLSAVALPWADWWEAYGLVSPAIPAVVWSLALAVLLGLGLLLRPLLRASESARFWLAGALLSALPAVATFPHDRLLLGVTVGWMAVLAELVTSVVPHGLGIRKLAISSLLLVHLGLAPLFLPVRAGSIDQLTHLLARSSSSLPPPDALRRMTVVLVNPPADPFAAYLPAHLELSRQTQPRHLLWLATGVSSLSIRRLDPFTLSIRPEHGFLSHSSQLMLRSPARKFALGDSVRLAAATFEVTALTPDERPAEVRVRFARPLDDPELVLLRWERHGYVRFVPPAQDEVRVLPAVDLLRALLG